MRRVGDGGILDDRLHVVEDESVATLAPIASATAAARIATIVMRRASRRDGAVDRRRQPDGSDRGVDPQRAVGDAAVERESSSAACPYCTPIFASRDAWT